MCVMIICVSDILLSVSFIKDLCIVHVGFLPNKLFMLKILWKLSHVVNFVIKDQYL